MKVSIIVPMYNSIDSIEQTVKSLLSQTFTNLEIILVDDGSTDGTGLKVKKLFRENNKIKYYFQENSGPNIARELGISKASGEYISFVDSDDFIDTNMIEKMVDVAIKNNADVIQCGYYEYSNGKIKREINLSDELIIFHNEKCLSAYVKKKNINNFLCNKIFKRDLFHEVKFPKLYAAEDQFALTQILYKTKKFVSIPDSFYFYVDNPMSLTRSKFNKNKLDNIKSGKLMYNFHKENTTGLEHYIALFLCSVSAQIYSSIIENNNSTLDLKKNLIETFNVYYPIGKKSSAWKQVSFNRRLLVRLFDISPVIASTLFNLKIKKDN